VQIEGVNMRRVVKPILLCGIVIVAFVLGLAAANYFGWRVMGQSARGDMLASQMGCIYLGHPMNGTVLMDDIRNTVAEASLRQVMEGGSEADGRKFYWKLVGSDESGGRCIVEASQNPGPDGPWIVQVRSEDSATQQKVTLALAQRWGMLRGLGK
jgi:hypothetical protein